MALSQEPAVNALPFWAGVLTQSTGHFAQVIKHGSSQGSIACIVQEAANVGSCMCQKKKKNSREETIQTEKLPVEWESTLLKDKCQL